MRPAATWVKNCLISGLMPRALSTSFTAVKVQ